MMKNKKKINKKQKKLLNKIKSKNNRKKKKLNKMIKNDFYYLL